MSDSMSFVERLVGRQKPLTTREYLNSVSLSPYESEISVEFMKASLKSQRIEWHKDLAKAGLNAGRICVAKILPINFVQKGTDKE